MRLLGAAELFGKLLLRFGHVGLSLSETKLRPPVVAVVVPELLVVSTAAGRVLQANVEYVSQPVSILTQPVCEDLDRTVDPNLLTIFDSILLFHLSSFNIIIQDAYMGSTRLNLARSSASLDTRLDLVYWSLSALALEPNTLTRAL